MLLSVAREARRLGEASRSGQMVGDPENGEMEVLFTSRAERHGAPAFPEQRHAQLQIMNRPTRESESLRWSTGQRAA